jgi:nicotinate-nucleotide pyrophosphorylase (carboxylating)
MLDNFSVPQLRRAVVVCRGRTRTEASGGVTLRSLPRLAGLGLDFISCARPPTRRSPPTLR